MRSEVSSTDIKAAFSAQSPEMHQITDHLVLVSDQHVETLRFKHAIPLLLRHAREYRARPYTYHTHASHTDRCFDAAFAMARREPETLYYCEGFLRAQEGRLVLAHGWCMTKEGRIVDPTMYAHQHEKGLTYLGLPIKLKYVEEWHKEVGFVGLLDGHPEGLPIGVHFDAPSLWLERLSGRMHDEA